MKKVNYSNIYKITFWKRSQNSIEHVNEYSLEKNENKWKLKINKNESEIPTQDVNDLISSLKSLKLDDVSDEYKAYYYEDNKKDYSLKFLLFIEDNSHIYSGYKGLYPFKQEKYKEIVDLFEQIKK